ncbi:TPA: dTMP kinase [Candidatus Saccharibacteria bacterium]|nr:dTMP kinase [Candidatus Saccharibacteria bacterium]HIO87352.1 dTMP kinase [Candidatus Saccharibacteria bacterium]
MIIELEGLDGAGKTTQVELLRNRLENSGYPAQVLRSPGGSGYGEAIRPIHLSDIERPPETDLLVVAGLLSANIAQAKFNAQNEIVTIFDRGLSSFYAYQGASGVNKQTIDTVLQVIGADPSGPNAPNVHIILDVDWQIGMQRISGRKLDAWEKRGAEFFTRVRELYRETPYGETIINANQTVEEVHEQIWQTVEEKLKKGS